MSEQKEVSMATAELMEKTETASAVSMRYLLNHKKEIKNFSDKEELTLMRKFYLAENPEELENLSPKEIMAMH